MATPTLDATVLASSMEIFGIIDCNPVDTGAGAVFSVTVVEEDVTNFRT
jgi:hypothetical protein